jgi:hypothetical protein
MNSRRFRFQPDLERLEARDVPSVTLLLDPSGNLTGIFGPPPIGSLSVTQTADNVFDIVEDGRDFGNFRVGGDLTMSLSNSTTFGVVTVDMNNHTFNGSVTISVGSNSMMPVGFGIWVNANAGGRLSGNLTIHTGNGNNNVLLTGAAGSTTVGGSIDAELGIGYNTVFIMNSTVGGNANVSNAENTVFGNNSSIGGFLTMDSSQVNLSNANLQHVFMNGMSIGSFLAIHTGTDNLDNILLGGGTTVFGNTILQMGNGTNMFTLQAGATIFGSLTYIGGSNNDILSFQTGSTVFGNVSLVLGNSGSGNGMLNFVDLAGTILGRQINIIGGNGTDFIRFEGNAPGAFLSASLFPGDDFFILNLTHGSLLGAAIDGGAGTNTFMGIGIPAGFRLTLRHFS